jgi:hypothetical protein
MKNQPKHKRSASLALVLVVSGATVGYLSQASDKKREYDLSAEPPVIIRIGGPASLTTGTAATLVSLEAFGKLVR